MPNASGSVDLSNLSREEEEALQSMAAQHSNNAPPEEEGAQKVLTTFLVVVGLDGNPQVMAVNDPRFDALVTLTRDHIFAAASIITKDLAAEETAMATAEIMQQQAMALQQQMQDQMLQRQVTAGLKTGGR